MATAMPSPMRRSTDMTSAKAPRRRKVAAPGCCTGNFLGRHWPPQNTARLLPDMSPLWKRTPWKRSTISGLAAPVLRLLPPSSSSLLDAPPLSSFALIILALSVS